MKEILLKYLTRFTILSEKEQQAIVEEIVTEEYKKGTILLRQGDVPTKCYFVLKGCVRQYSIDEIRIRSHPKISAWKSTVDVWILWKVALGSPSTTRFP